MEIAGEKNNLLGSTVDNDTNAIELAGKWKIFDKVNGNRMPWTERNRKGTEETVRLVPRGFVALAMSTGFAIVSDESPHPGPDMFMSD